jgi:hypothetical protein
VTVALKVAMTLVLSQYIRTKVDDTNANSQCLWWLDSTTITYHQNVQGNPDVSGDSEFTAVAASFSTWQTQLTACGSLTFTEGERTQSRTVGYNTSGSNENVVLFRMQKCIDVAPANDPCWAASTCGNVHDCWEHSNTAIAITSTSYTPSTGRDLDSDIELNQPSFAFTAGTPVITDVQNTVTHEAGHVLGLAHINLAGSTMNARADTGEISKRTLDEGSKQFICDVYPKGKPTKTCQIPTLTNTLGSPAKTGCTSVPSGAMVAAALFACAMRRRA